METNTIENEENMLECIRQYVDGAITKIEMYYKMHQLMNACRLSISVKDMLEFNAFATPENRIQIPEPFGQILAV